MPKIHTLTLGLYQTNTYIVQQDNRCIIVDPGYEPEAILAFLQEVAGDHSTLLGTDRKTLQERNLFWAVIRHRVQINRLPQAGERITVETWPMPTTRSAYPRATVMLDENGKELLRSISLWVLMDTESRKMVLPGKSGVEVSGILRGNELDAPGSMAPSELANSMARHVRFSDLDLNGHMNNCRYPDWVSDVLPASFHSRNTLKDFSICYLSECREADEVTLQWELGDDNTLSVNAMRKSTPESATQERVFATKMQF